MPHGPRGDQYVVSVQWADAETVDIVRKLFLLSGNEKPIERVRWQYLSPPSGTIVAFAYPAESPDQAVSMYAAFASTALMHGKQTTVLQSFDTLTLADHRGRGLFPRLAEVVFKFAMENGVAAIYGIPNAASMPGFRDKLGWSVKGPVPLFVRPIGLRYPMRRVGLRRAALKVRGPGLGSDADSFAIPSDVEEISHAGSDFEVLRDEAYLRRRYSRPGVRYRSHSIRDSAGVLNAFAISTIGEKHGANVGYLCEFFVRPGNRRAGMEILRSVVDGLAHDGADLIFAWTYDRELRSCLRRKAFVSIPPKLRPIDLYVAGKGLAGAATLQFADGDWFLSYSDSDTV